MILNDKDAVARLNSPMNLMNKLKSLSNGNGKRQSAMSLFGIGQNVVVTKVDFDKKELTVQPTFNPFESKKPQPQQSLTVIPPTPTPTNIPDSPATLDSILENHDSQIKLGLAHDTALDLLNNSVKMLADKLDDVKADKLPSVIAAASKTVESIRKERNEANRTNKDRDVHYHFYTPEQKKISDYEIIEVQ